MTQLYDVYVQACNNTRQVYDNLEKEGKPLHVILKDASFQLALTFQLEARQVWLESRHPPMT